MYIYIYIYIYTFNPVETIKIRNKHQGMGQNTLKGLKICQLYSHLNIFECIEV